MQNFRIITSRTTDILRFDIYIFSPIVGRTDPTTKKKSYSYVFNSYVYIKVALYF